MPRKARIDAPGAIHHVIVRGIERGKIFRSDYDRKKFLNRLGKLIPETQTDCFAWAMNKTKQAWQNVDYVYGLFSEKKRMARTRYRVYVEKGILDGKRPDLTGGELFRSTCGWAVLKGLRKVGIRVKGDERILGDSDFVENVLKSAEEELEQKYDLKARGYDFDRVAQRVAEVMEIEIEQVKDFGKSPQTVKARSLLCFWAHRKLGMTTIEIGRRLNISQSAVSRSSMRGQQIERENRFELID